jgi:hypothetical protein
MATAAVTATAPTLECTADVVHAPLALVSQPADNAAMQTQFQSRSLPSSRSGIRLTDSHLLVQVAGGRWRAGCITVSSLATETPIVPFATNTVAAATVLIEISVALRDFSATEMARHASGDRFEGLHVLLRGTVESLVLHPLPHSASELVVFRRQGDGRQAPRRYGVRLGGVLVPGVMLAVHADPLSFESAVRLAGVRLADLRQI